MDCRLFHTIVDEAVGRNTTGDYHDAQAAVAVLLLTGRLCGGHERIANKLINTRDELGPLFAEALKELQLVERLRRFARNFSKMFPGEPDDMPLHVFKAAAAGNFAARMLVEMLSIVEPDEESDDDDIPVRTGPKVVQ